MNVFIGFQCAKHSVRADYHPPPHLPAALLPQQQTCRVRGEEEKEGGWAIIQRVREVQRLQNNYVT